MPGPTLSLSVSCILSCGQGGGHVPDRRLENCEREGEQVEQGGKKSSLFHLWGENTGAKAGRMEIEQGRKLKVPHAVSFDPFFL